MKIGLEIHATLNTKSKLFCSCDSKGESPNSNICEICLGHPGSKPVLNKLALEKALLVAKALNCEVTNNALFSRKNYFYPDLSKNYQITMLEPLGKDGYLDVDGKVGIQQVHLEEDPASSTRENNHSLLDYNRSGVPLVEIVTKPDIKSAEQARKFMRYLLRVLNYLDVFDADSVIKADVNVSLKKNNFERVEVKNVTGFKDIQRVIEYEIKRQSKEKIVQETRGWDSLKGVTYNMRLKESASDYGYIYDPDLPIFDTKSFDLTLPEMPWDKIKRYKKLGVADDDADIISSNHQAALLFDNIIKNIDPVLVSKWFRTEIFSYLDEKDLNETFFTENNLKELFNLLISKKINYPTGKEILKKLSEKDFSPKDYVTKNNLIQVSDDSKIVELTKKAIKENPSAVNDYLKGEEKSLNFLVGQVMKATKGKADPGKTSNIIKKELKK